MIFKALSARTRIQTFLVFSFAGAFLNSLSYILFFEFVSVGAAPLVVVVSCAAIGAVIIPVLLLVDRRVILRGEGRGVTTRASRIVFWVMLAWFLTTSADQYLFRAGLYERLGSTLALNGNSPLLCFYCTIAVMPGLLVLAGCLTIYFDSLEKALKADRT